MIFRHCRGFIRDLEIMRLDIKIFRIYHEISSPGGRTRDISGGLGRMRRSRRIPPERIYHPTRDPRNETSRNPR